MTPITHSHRHYTVVLFLVKKYLKNHESASIFLSCLSGVRLINGGALPFAVLIVEVGVLVLKLVVSTTDDSSPHFGCLLSGSVIERGREWEFQKQKVRLVSDVSPSLLLCMK